MKKLIAAAAATIVLGLAAPASAADLAARPYTKAPPMVAAIYDWSGFYIGVNGGWGTSRNCWDFTDPSGVFIATEGCHNATGGVLGGQIGYRAQFRSRVFGVEAQGDWANLHGSNVSEAFPPFVNESRIAALGLLTGQIGYAFNNFLIYAKGGAAVTKTHYITTAGGVLAATAPDQTRWGGTVGGGIEWGFAPNWSVAVEYDHLFMGNDAVTFPASAIAVTRSDNIRQDVDMGTVRVNYRFGGPIAAR